MFVNEVFRSIQGEGVRAGTVNTFVRFGKCNLACTVESVGFDCDTEFASGRTLSVRELLAEMGEPGWTILTGGEPSLQIDQQFIDMLHAAGWKIAIETNGTMSLPSGIDWITVSPKTAEHTIRPRVANEVKYVRRHGQAIPQPTVKAEHYLISPAWGPDGLDPRDLAWCVQLVKDNPDWRLSCQQHKWWGVR